METRYARATPPAPPRGPISRVSASLTLRLPPAAVGRARIGFATAPPRRNICPHFSLSSAHGSMTAMAPHLVKGLLRTERSVARCQLRGGVHLEAEYVGEVCISPRFNQCVFYEDGLAAD